MSDSIDPQRVVDSTMDLRVAEILDQFLQQQEEGNAPTREEFLRQHPDIADRLATCLDGVELFGAAETNESPTKKDLIEPPEVIGDYEILSQIGQGGMGVVYEAREKSLDRIVALKVMRFGIVDPRALERFQREAETAGALHHTNIVPVYATGREGDTSWYAMQRIEGESLSQRIHRAYGEKSATPVSNDEVVDVGLQAAEALDHAHQRDVVHRDVKPGNLILDRDGRVWLTDFGLARRLVDVGATMTGALLGTPRYMSPEQADVARVDVDHRSDIYSLGATLYELATGRPPFEGDDPLNVISQIRFEEPPSPRSIRPSISRDVDVVLMKCLSKDSSRRYATAAELADDLRAIQDDRPIRAKPTSIFEHASRWGRKHQGLVRAASVTAMATALVLMMGMLGLENWREENQSAFRLRAPGGPYSTTIRPVDSAGASDAEPMKSTVPMQSYQKLPHGDYDVLLSARGRWSQKVRLPIRKGVDSEFKIQSQEPPVREISIKDAFAAVTADFDGPAIIWSRDGELRRYSVKEDADWKMQASEIETQVIDLHSSADSEEEDANEPDGDNSLEVDFAKFPPLQKTPWLRNRFHKTPLLACPQRILRSAIDLDNDGRADSVVAAMGRSALMAVNASGEILWAKAYDLNGNLREGNPSNLSRPVELVLPGIVDMHEVGDRNEDGTPDILVQMVHIQPGIRNDVCLSLLDGRTGEALVTKRPPTLKVKDNAHWSWDGYLRYFHDQTGRRGTKTMRFYDNRTQHGTSSDNRTINHSYRGRATFAVPSPLTVAQDTDQLLAIYASGNHCFVYDMLLGEVVGAPIQLGGLISGKPQLVRLGQNDGRTNWGLLVQEARRNHTFADGTIHGARFATYSLDGKLIWEQIRESPDFKESTGAPSRVDWPLVADVDDDGIDEILMPAKTRMYHLKDQWQQVLMLVDSRTGDDLWELDTPQLCGLDRLAVTADIDHDGTKDFACASVIGSPRADLSPGVSSEIGIASVYIDWVSGATGKTITWARHPITPAPREIGRADIDGIRCKIDGRDTRLVEVDIASGSKEETEMDSMTIQFLPSSHDAVAVASGVTNCAAKLSAMAKTRPFYRRPGPFLDGDETIVFLRDRPNDTVRVGESEVLASWNTLDATNSKKLAAVKGLTAERLSVVDVATQETIWSTQSNVSDNPAFVPIMRQNGTFDFLVSQARYNSPPQLLDGETGEPKWTMSAEQGGNVRHAASLMAEGKGKERFFVIGDGQAYRHDVERPESFRMSMVNADSGRVLWAKQFLHGATRHNAPSNFSDVQFFDVNGDGVLDVLGPEQLEDEKQVRLAVWDGTNGDCLWTSQPLKEGGESSYYPGPFVAFQIQGQPRVANVQLKDDLAEVVLRDAADGKVLSTLLLPDGLKRLAYAERYMPAQYGLMYVATKTDDTTELRFSSELRGTLTSAVVEVESNDDMAVLSTWTDEDRKTRYVWLKDTNGDQIDEQLTLKRDALVCRDIETNKVIWQLELRNQYRQATFDDQSRTVWLHDYTYVNQEVVESPPPTILVDLENGTIVAEFETSQFSQGKLPRVVSNDQRRMTLLWPLSGGTRVQHLSPTESQVTIPRPTKADPRRIGHYLFAQHGRSVYRIVVSGLRAAFILLAYVLPFLYVGIMFVRKQWSLSFFLLSPLIALLFFMVTRSDDFGFLTLQEGWWWLATPMGVWWAVRDPGGKDTPISPFPPKAKWPFLGALIVISFLALVGVEYHRLEDFVDYQFGLRETVFALVTIFSYAFRYWFGFLFISLIFRKIGLFQPSAAASTKIGATS